MTPERTMTVTPSVVTSLAQIGELYRQGTPLRVLRRKYHLSDSEAQDVAPEEDLPEGDSVSGY